MNLSKCGIVAFVGIGALLPALIRGATIRDDQPAGGYLNLAGSPDYASVGSFVNNWGFTGSATLIAPDWVLTAAHNLAAATSGTFTIGGVSYTSTQVIRHPGWQSGNLFAGNDFGLVQLSTAVAGVTPATLYTGSLEFGLTATFVGFGFTGTGLTGYQTVDGQKRAFQNVIDGDFGTPALVLGSDFDNPHSIADNAFGSTNALSLEGAVAPGDSGGGVFLVDGSQSYLAGIISFVAATDGSANADYGDVSGFGRVSALNPWILSTIPEPSAFTLLPVAGLVMLLGRRFLRVNQ
ncbi:MAG TPA: trypsin-like serine protease [Verrucomicrobiae bacterium]|nr:trypsin-like serine protease [Verrucomicrobiae bacterium]